MNKQGIKLVGIKYLKTKKFNINVNGIQVIEQEDKVIIYNDPFRTVPLFILRISDKELLLFSDFEEFYKNALEIKIDEVGFWEIILYGNSLWTRTLYVNLKQMPSASKLTIDTKNKTYTIEKYWNFDILENKDINSLEKAAKGFHDILYKIFKNLKTDVKYVMGMSGGLDSRITLSLLSKFIPKENLQLFTYAHHKKSLEYKYAKQITKSLNFNSPHFHKLTFSSYKEAMKYLPLASGGQISINHCHILDYFNSTELSNTNQLSTYFSDAVFGFESIEKKRNNYLNENSYHEKLDKSDFLSSEIKNEILKDISRMIKGFNVNANFSSINEFIYVTERSQKFHTYLAYIQNKKVKETILPYAHLELLNYFFSIPIKYRSQKKIISYLLSNYYNFNSKNNFKSISSLNFRSDNSIATFEDIRFKLLNRINAVMRPITNGHIQIPNKFQTEELERILYRDLRQNLKKSTEFFQQIGLFNSHQVILFNKLPLRSAGINERYHIISLYSFLSNEKQF